MISLRGWSVGAAATVVLVGGCSTGSGHPLPRPGEAFSAAPHTGPLWQAAFNDPVLAGHLVAGLVDSPHADVKAVEALTGRTAWTATMPGHPRTERLLADADSVGVETGRTVGNAPASVGSIVTGFTMLDAGTGRRLWSIPITGHTQKPPVIIDDGKVITGDHAGGLTARSERSGQILWRQSRPADCGFFGELRDDQTITADSMVLVVSYICQGGKLLLRRLRPADGTQLWRWQSEQGPATITAAVASSAGGVIVLTGGPEDLSTGQAGRPTRFAWPTALGPSGRGQTLALDSTTGRPLWIEAGSQESQLAVSGTAVCALTAEGAQCRADRTGKPTGPPILTGQEASATPPSGEGGYAGIAGGRLYLALPPTDSGRVEMEIRSVAGSRSLGDTDLPVSGNNVDDARYTPFIHEAFTISGHTIVLTQRIDDNNYPYAAILVPTG